MKKIWISAWPYTVRYGSIEVPDDVGDIDVRGYLEDNWNDIIWGDAEFDHEGCGYEFDFDE